MVYPPFLDKEGQIWARVSNIENRIAENEIPVDFNKWNGTTYEEVEPNRF